jgi:M6 family metalloprotease-like protein
MTASVRALDPAAGFAAALVLLLVTMLPPASVHAAPGDLVLRKTATAPTPAGTAAPSSARSTGGRAAARTAPALVTGGFGAAPAAGAPVAAAPANFAALARRRAQFPHVVYARGFDPGHQVGGRALRSHMDIFHAMERRADARAARASAPLGSLSSIAPVEASVPGQDTVRIAILRFDFLNDRGGDKSSGDGKFDLSPRDTLNRPLDPTPHNKAFFAAHGEALRRYNRDQYNGRVVFEFTVYPSASDSAFHLSDMADYGPWKFSTDIYGAAVKLFRDQIVAADTSGENIPWHNFDRICLVHAGSDLQSDVNADSPEDIPTFTLGVADTDAVVVGPARADTIFGCTIGPETIRQDGYEGTINAVYTHEFGHLVFGYRDVYDVVSGLPTVGYWSLMDTGNLLGNSITFPNGTAVYAVGILPPAVDPWQKRLVYDDVPSAPEPPYGQPAALGDIERNFTTYKVPISGEEYLLIENRLDDLNGNHSLTLARDSTSGVILGPAASDSMEYDFLIPGPGALVWHVDESVADFFGPRADPGFGLNVNRSRFGLDVIEGDGLDDLGDFNTPYPLGASTDPWYVGNATQLNDTTVPKLATNSGTDPHLDIQFTSPPGPNMTLQVSRQWDLPGWPVKIKQPAGGISPIVTALGPNAIPCVVWAAGDSAVHARRGDGSFLAPGATDDVVFRGAGPLGPVTAVGAGASVGGTFLAVGNAVSDTFAVGQEGRIDFIHFAADGSTVLNGYLPSLVVPSPITAGPASQSPIAIPLAGDPAPVFIGCANGDVISIALTGAAGAQTDVITTPAHLASRVTGLAAVGAHVYAASQHGDLGIDAAVTAGAIAAGHDLQPIYFTRIVEGGGTVEFLAIVDRTVGAMSLLENPGTGWVAVPVESQNHPLGEPIGPPALADVDGDGLPEIVFTTASGRVGYWNDNGSLSPGWPPNVEQEAFTTRAGPLPLTLPSSGASLILASLGNGTLTALDAQQKPAPGFPLGLSVGARGTGALTTGTFLVDGPPTLFIAGGDTLLYGIGLFSLGTQGLAATSSWACEGGGAGRGYAVQTPFAPSGAITGASAAILPGTLKVYPNPARQAPVTFAFRLRQAGQVSVKIYDAAARQVAEFTRAGSTSDNAITWDPGGHPSGLYVARIEVPGQVVTQPFALLR